MKGILVILSLLLSCLNGGGMPSCKDDVSGTTCIIAESDESSTSEDQADFNEFALLPVRTASYSGGSGGSSPTVQSSNSGRRITPSSKSAFRVIKSSKVFDKQHFHKFLSDIHQFQTGIHSPERYIHSICSLLI